MTEEQTAALAQQLVETMQNFGAANTAAIILAAVAAIIALTMLAVAFKVLPPLIRAYSDAQRTILSQTEEIGDLHEGFAESRDGFKNALDQAQTTNAKLVAELDRALRDWQQQTDNNGKLNETLDRALDVLPDMFAMIDRYKGILEGVGLALHGLGEEVGSIETRDEADKRTSRAVELITSRLNAMEIALGEVKREVAPIGSVKQTLDRVLENIGVIRDALTKTDELPVIDASISVDPAGDTAG